MTPCEYLEHVQESLAFPPRGVGHDPKFLLYVSEEKCRVLRDAHTQYCATVAAILGIKLPDPNEESGGPEDRPDTHGLSLGAYVQHLIDSRPVESEGGSAD